MFVLKALVLTFMTTPLVNYLYPPQSRRHTSVAKTVPFHFQDHGGLSSIDNVKTNNTVSKRRITIILDKLEQVPAAMAFSRLVTPHISPPQNSHCSSSTSTFINGAHTPPEPISIQALRLIELSDRPSTVIKSSINDALLSADLVLAVFRRFCELSSGLAVTPAIDIANHDDDVALSVAAHARTHRSDIVVLPWLLHTDTVSPDPDLESVSKPQTAPVTAVIRELQNELALDPLVAIHSRVFQNVMKASEVDVAIFITRVDWGPGAKHIFFPFFGGPDDRRALEFVAQLCENDNVSATVLRIFKAPDDSSHSKAPLVLHRSQIDDADDSAWEHFTSRPSHAGPRLVCKHIITDSPLHDSIHEAESCKQRGAQLLIVVGRRHDVDHAHELEGMEAHRGLSNELRNAGYSCTIPEDSLATVDWSTVNCQDVDEPAFTGHPTRFQQLAAQALTVAWEFIKSSHLNTLVSYPYVSGPRTFTINDWVTGLDHTYLSDSNRFPSNDSDINDKPPALDNIRLQQHPPLCRIYVAVWDIGLTLINLVTPKRKVGQVTPAGHPGADGKWPEYIPPKEGDSRCCCPALNAMANHGILPRDGKNIPFKEATDLVISTFNFSPSFSYFTSNYAANVLNKNHNTDTFNLAELNLHNGIEHDASLVHQHILTTQLKGRDLYFEPNPAVIHVPFVKELLESATGKDADGNLLLTIPDISLILSKRRAQGRAENPEFSLDAIHRTFGSAKYVLSLPYLKNRRMMSHAFHRSAATFLTIFGGRVKDLETILLEERLPEGWESRIRETKGLTLITFNSKTVKKVENGIDESKFAPSATFAGEPATSSATQTPTAPA
ncbi:hypothetical protein H0H92_010915 [Tricholoma furcatifolium]|nr:hypothetical protein H0H92_010915 [Tricholoma furcatifolium]